jgi:single-stranded-DNA-specific exonuclease
LNSSSNYNKVSVQKILRLYPQNYEKRAALSKKLNIALPAAQVLINRGINTVEEGEAFLKPDLSRLHSPFLMKDMEPAVEILINAIKSGDKIAVYGDYDVDGITSTAILFLLLQNLGGAVIFYIPDRQQEGYSLNCAALDHLKSRGVSTIVTVDCGINSFVEAEYARKLQMKMIITDHHQPADALPEAAAVINPLRSDCTYPFKGLCGAGVAFKLGQALLMRTGKDAKGDDFAGDDHAGDDHAGDVESGGSINILDYLDLVALGTVADISPLVEENRILVVHGLMQMKRNLRPGLKALCEVAALNKERITARDLAFIIAPRLNAAGRMGDASRSLYLLLEGEAEKVRKMAEELHEENKRRQALELKIFNEACRMVEEGKESQGRSFILLAGEGWHSGVLGIVASRMVEKYNVPVILVALEDGAAKGSGRSAGNFDLFSALSRCKSILVSFGGHSQAAGLTVSEENIVLLREKLNALAEKHFESSPAADVLYADAELEPEEITPDLVRELGMLEPFGPGNPEPCFFGKKWFLEKKREVGKRLQHLQLNLKKNDQGFYGISFNGKSRLPEADLFREIDLAFNISFDRWRGNDALQLEIFHFSYCDEFIGGKLSIVDKRETVRKISYVNNLLEKGEGVLIFVNTVGRLNNLKKIFSGGRQIFFSHQGKIFSNNYGKAPKHIVLFDLPLAEMQLTQLLGSLSNFDNRDFQLHLLFGSRDYNENMKLLLATVPAFSSLELIYSALQKVASKEPVPLASACSRIRKMLPFTATKFLLEKCMEIFLEASHLDLNEKGIFLRNNSSDPCILLRDLSRIEIFQKGRLKWKETLLWQQFLLEEAGEEILHYLNDFTNLDT